MQSLLQSLSQRTKRLGTENAFVVLAEVNQRIRRGKDIINFCIGQPDFPTPQNIKKAAINAIEQNKSSYTDAAGLYDVRVTLANYLTKSRAIPVHPEHVVIANGAKPFIAFAILATTDYGTGDEVIYPSPGFPIYESQIMANGAVPVPVPLVEENGFGFDLDILKQKVNSKTKLLIINSPHNPTGGVLQKEDLVEIAKLAMHYHFWIYSDEPYCKLTYDAPFVSIASLSGMYAQTIIVDGASKSYAMTGWRMGFAANPTLAPYFATWMANTESCANHIAQCALKEAFSGPQEESDAMMKSFKERRNLMVKVLNMIPGVHCHMPGGAFYAFPNVTKACYSLGLPNAEAFRTLLLENGVAVLADIHFGPKNPGQKQEYIRLSYATAPEKIIEGCQRIKAVVEGKKTWELSTKQGTSIPTPLTH
ncbi:aminotransferase class I/II-fold pyridoxal phosphate-dependent enzyme [Candidatus Woesearchaeota archaeon]|nr:aminotransferase class I/II-fold pyridoxal phosphate-dependent enzyme [Candidatus Woesearchaeota archaeon]